MSEIFKQKRRNKCTMKLGLNRPISFTSLRRQLNNGKPPKHSLLLRVGAKKILFDPGCGAKSLRVQPIDGLTAIVVTHAHLDHFGDLLSFVKRNPLARVFCTGATRFFIEQYFSRKGSGVSQFDLAAMMNKFVTCDYERETRIEKGISLSFHFSGHMLGAAACTLFTPEGNILVTGDYSDKERFVLRPFSLPNHEYRAVVSESTFVQMPEPDFEKESGALVDRVGKILTGGGHFIISSDMLGSAQEFLFYLASLMQKQEFPQYPIFCFDLEKRNGSSNSTLPIIDAYQSNFRTLSRHFRKAFGSQHKNFLDHFAGLTPLAGEFNPDFLRPALILMHTWAFKTGNYYGFKLAEFGGKVFKAGGGLMLSHANGGNEEMFKRLDLPAGQYDPFVLFPPPFNHPYSASVRKLIEAAGAQTTILVHGRKEAMLQFAAGFSDRTVIVPEVGQEILL